MLSEISVTLKSKNDIAVYLLDFELAREQEHIMLITSFLQKTDYHWLMNSLIFIKYTILKKWEICQGKYANAKLKPKKLYSLHQLHQLMHHCHISQIFFLNYYTL